MRYTNPNRFKASRERKRPEGPRTGFTLVELLVVIGIITIIASLSAAGIFQVIASQRHTNTERTLKALSTTLQKQWAQVVARADKETIPPSVLALAGGEVHRARVIWKKLRLKQEFPMTFAEAREPHKSFTGAVLLSATDLPPLRAYLSLPTTALADPFLESSTCLLLALSQSRTGATLPADLMGPASNDLNGDGLKELVDSWNSPISFFRFPTDNDELNSTNPSRSGSSSTFRDPLDPKGYLLQSPWYFSPFSSFTQGDVYEALCHKIHTGTNPGTYQPWSRFIVPVLVSAGPNSKWGLNRSHTSNPDLSISAPSDANDNIMSFQVEGRGD